MRYNLSLDTYWLCAMYTLRTLAFHNISASFYMKDAGNLRITSKNHNLLNSFQIIFLLKVPHLDPNALTMRPFEEKEPIITCAVFFQTLHWDGDGSKEHLHSSNRPDVSLAPWPSL